MPLNIFFRIWVFLLAVLTVATTVAAVPASPNVAWDRIEVDGEQIGYATTRTKTLGNEVHTEERIELILRLGGKRETLRLRTIWIETRDGQPLRYARVSIGRSTKIKIDAHVEQGKFVAIASDDQGARSARLDLLGNLLFPHALAARIRDVRAGKASEIRVDEFDAARMRFESATLAPQDRTMVANTVLQKWQRQSLGNSGAEISTLFWHTPTQRVIKPLQVAGQLAERIPCAAPCVFEKTPTIDLLDGLLRPAPFRIPKNLLSEKLRFVLKSRSGIAPAVPETNEQSVIRRHGRTIVTICNDCGSESAPSSDQLQRYLSPNAWVQSDAPSIRRLADRARAGRGNVAKRMRALVRTVQTHMQGEIELADYADALTALKSRSGDCTEFAVLLAALARAQGIPTRVVAGIAYSARFTGRSHVFSPHAWVHAWTGERWQSFDAGLGQFDSGHIVLAIGDGRPEDYSSALRALRGLDVVDAGRIQAAIQTH